MLQKQKQSQMQKQKTLQKQKSLLQDLKRQWTMTSIQQMPLQQSLTL